MNQHINQLLDWTPNTELSEKPMVSAEEHCRGMRHFAMGVSTITTGNDKARAGLTATAVCSVTADPPRLVVFVNKGVYASELILKNGSLCVNILAGEQEDVAKAFAGMIKEVQGEARFEYGHWDTLATGSPTLQNALANFDCRVVKVFDESTHHAFLCEVLGMREREDGEALIYLNGGFRQIPQ